MTGRVSTIANTRDLTYSPDKSPHHILIILLVTIDMLGPKFMPGPMRSSRKRHHALLLKRDGTIAVLRYEPQRNAQLLLDLVVPPRPVKHPSVFRVSRSARPWYVIVEARKGPIHIWPMHKVMFSVVVEDWPIESVEGNTGFFSEPLRISMVGVDGDVEDERGRTPDVEERVFRRDHRELNGGVDLIGE
jgi:hypothetical protein